MIKRRAERIEKGLEILRGVEGRQRKGNQYLTEGNSPSYQKG